MSTIVIIADTETTGLLAPEAAGPVVQPRVIEFAAQKFSLSGKRLNHIGQMEFLCNPGEPIPPEVTKITGIQDKDVRSKKSFAWHWEALADFFVGVHRFVAHNAPFDKEVLAWEMERMERMTSFPWPPTTHDTVQITQSWQGKYLRLTDLYEMAAGQRYDEKAHRALDDVKALAHVYQWLLENGHVD